MARIDRYKEHYQGAIYHIFNRGVNKKEVFINEDDYLFYLWKIRKYKKLYQVEFISYALLPNHYHYQVRQLSSIPISKFMYVLHTSYVHYFNKKYKRVGPLYQARYKQRIVTNLNYFIWISAYINGNVEIHRKVPSAKEWPYASLLDYAGIRNGTLCNKQVVLNYFNNTNEYLDYIKNITEECQYNKEIYRGLEE